MFRRREASVRDDLAERETVTATRVEMPRRVVDIPVAPAGLGYGPGASHVGRVTVGSDFGPTLLANTVHRSDAEATRQLAVGPGIRLEGTIDGCERLVIDGQVKATLEATEHLVVHEGGRFEGRGEVETAEVAGDFDGGLVVRGRLWIRATGRVRGDIRVGELEIERGGQLLGNVEAHTKGPQLAPVATAVGGD